MTEASTSSVRVADIKDPVVLFERYSTEEIRGIECKVRGQIEQKKEELRQMVGERYRDLIDAADTIGEMRHSSASVVQSIQDMHRYCQGLKQGSKVGASTSNPERQRQETFYIMASQIKLLLEIPERIWSAMEASHYLQATRLYLLCCHLHSLLHLEAATGGHYSPVLARFPIIVRQVATTAHFRSTILLDSKSLLRGRAVSDQAIAEALLSTMLLEDSSPRQVLADFLLARKASIQHLLNQPQHGAGVKAQVCSLVELLVTTLFQAYAVFYTSSEGGARPGEATLGCGLLFSLLENVTSSAPAGKGTGVLEEHTSTGSWFRYLPRSVTDFQPTLRTLAQPIQREQLRDTLQQWIHTCKEDICHGVSSLLVYVKSLKGLAAIRDAVWDLLSTDSIQRHWSTVCQRLLERPLAVWDDFLQQLFLQRLQAITKEETEAISVSSVQLLTSAVRDLEEQTTASCSGSNISAQYEADVASYLWSESAGDLLSDAGWVSVSQRGQQQRSGLAMKTQALTPCVQNFCSSLDGKLKERLDDLQHYLPSQNTVVAPSTEQKENTLPSSFNRFTDSLAVEEALQDGCHTCIRRILSAIRTELSAAPSGYACPSSVLFMARLCQSVAELCPSLKQCIVGRQRAGEAAAKAASRQSKKLGKSKVAAEVNAAQAKWAELKEELVQCSLEGYRIWSSALSKTLLDCFGAGLHADSAGAVLTTATSWEDLEIQEEAQSGSSITSKIRVPVQPSWFVQSLLFRLCAEVNRIGGHTLPRATLHELLQACLDQVLQEYHRLTQQTPGEGIFPMTQNRALQMMFDLWYLNATLSAKRSPQDPRMQAVCDWLESHIDPFDLDVFTTPLNANLHRLCQRTSVLFGLLTVLEKPFGWRSSSATSQEPHNILPLSSSPIRFGLLPLSMSGLHKSKIATKSSNSHQLTSKAENGRLKAGSIFRQLADQEEDSSSPALFKLPWLSGMTK